jgi:hypothetical protein
MVTNTMFCLILGAPIFAVLLTALDRHFQMRRLENKLDRVIASVPGWSK